MTLIANIIIALNVKQNKIEGQAKSKQEEVTIKMITKKFSPIVSLL